MYKEEIAAGPAYQFEIYRTGHCRVKGEFAFRTLDRETDHGYTIYIGVIKGHGINALVDTGMVSVDEMNRGAGFLMTELITQQPGEDTLSIVAKAGLKPEDINYIFLTHCHYDHCSMAVAFPNASVVVPQIAWEAWHASPENTRYLHEGFLAYLEELHRAGRLILSRDGAVLPGIGTIWVGGHSVCSQLVLVNTRQGVVMNGGDAIQMYRNVQENDIIFICDDPPLGWRALDLGRREADILLPGHDPTVADKYPDHIIA